MKWRLIPLFLVVLLSLPTVMALTQLGFFPIHDDQHVVRLSEMKQAVVEGQLPVRWVSSLGFGYGYPLFVFYPPLVYYLGVGLSLLPFSFLEITKILFGLSLLFSAVSMYVWARSRLPRLSAMCAALLYVYAPYRAVDVYVRGALAEAMSFVWLPLVFWALESWLLSGKTKALWWYALLFSLSMITHNLITLPLALTIGLYTLVHLIVSPSKQMWQRAWILLGFSVLGLAASAWFWVPALYEKQFTIVDSILLSELYDYRLHFVAPMQLWNSLWGFGGSTAGLLDGMSFKVSKPLLVAIGVAILAVVVGVKKRAVRSFLPLAVLTLVSLCMTTQASAFVWELVSPLSFLQFPWRFLTFVVLFGSLLAASLSTVIPASFSWLVSRSSLLTFVLLLSGYLGVVVVTLVHVGIHSKLFEPQTVLDRGDAYYLDPEVKSYQVSNTSFEFVPKGVPTTTDNQLGITQVKIDRSEIVTTPELRVVKGRARITPERTDMHHYRFQVEAETPLQLELTQFAYPGWQIRVNHELTDIQSFSEWPLLGFEVMPGLSTVDIKLIVPWWRRLAEMISLVSLGLIGYNLVRRTNDRRY